MFSRPELIPSQRMLRQTPVERLEQMLAEAPHAKAAEELLRCLVMFQSLIRHKDIAGMTPQSMDETTRANAFMTLRDWVLVQRVTRHQYRISDSIKERYPPSQDLQERYFTYFFNRRTALWDHVFLHNYWKDITSNLLWSIEHRPDKTLYFAQGIARCFYIPNVIEEWPFYLRIMLDTAARLNDGALQSFAFDQLGDRAYRDKNFTSADHWYAQALTFYPQSGHEIKQADLLTRRAKIALMQHRFAEARGYYEQALALYPPTHRNVRSILVGFYHVEIEAENLEGARAALDRIFLPSPTWTRSRYLLDLGTLLHKKGLYEESRDAFARSLSLTDGTPTGKIYEAWGKMEYDAGNSAAGCALYRLALLKRYPGENPNLRDDETQEWSEFLEMRATLSAMGCHDD